jgi:hypothetical protein
MKKKFYKLEGCKFQGVATVKSFLQPYWPLQTNLQSKASKGSSPLLSGAQEGLHTVSREQCDFKLQTVIELYRI